MTCKDCLHYESHKHFFNSPNYKKDFDDYFKDKDIEHKCPEFTNRSEWVHLPCKVGDDVYCIFENKVCIANVLALYIDKVGIICELQISLNGELPTAPCSVCHIDRDSYTDNDIYLTREEAEKALEGMK